MTDPRAAYLAQFCETTGYLDFARYGPPSRAVVAASATAMHSGAMAGPDTVDELMSATDRAVRAVARLAGFATSSVVLVPNTSTGLFQAAFAIPFEPAIGEVLVSGSDFPANHYPWARAAQAGRFRLRVLAPPGGRMTPEGIRAELRPDTTAVSVSAVDFATGYRADLAGIREVIGERLLIVDGIQGFGVTTQPWEVCDILVVGGQKWLRAGWGTGFLALSDRALERVDPLLSGWTGAVDPTHYDGLIHPHAHGAARFSLTNLSPVDHAAFAAALELVESVGPAWIERRIGERIDALHEALLPLDPMIRSALDPAHRAGILAFALADHQPAQLGKRLAAGGVTATVHAGAVRLSVHATTTDAAIEAVTSTIRESRRQGAW
ncbi:aminotransferase class V-fold PLP-dependent enzyme [Nocardia colli]|uniref:aminotransferase class V-fold PLP-dependent enzyme n=1 Tax=Nocardia colli TaxID=2545717 RepID=UPI00168CF99C|nr:aminotransferase class V-fold PLP-dependent enzyme [Nocardia colli]